MSLRRLLTTLFLTLVTSINVISQTIYIPYTHETLTISSAALPFTAGKLQDASNNINKAAYIVFDVNCASGTACILRYTVIGPLNL